MSPRVRTTVFLVLLMLVAAMEDPGPGGAPVAARDANVDVFMGCLGQTAPGAFSLAVSRVLPNDPLRIETYGLVGSGGLVLSDHVDHTIEVTGALEEAGEAFPRLRVSSARPVATECWRP
jgi:hypothetical protein